MTTGLLLLGSFACAFGGGYFLVNAAYVANDHESPSRARARATRQSAFAGVALIILALALFAAAVGWSAVNLLLMIFASAAAVSAVFWIAFSLDCIRAGTELSVDLSGHALVGIVFSWLSTFCSLICLALALGWRP